MTAIPAPNRRVLLFGAALLATAPAVSGCGLLDDDRPEPPDPLEDLRGSALSDAAFAESISLGFPDLRARAGQVAQDRAAHAEALDRELNRARPRRTESPTPPPPAPPATPADRRAATTALTQAMRAAEQQAAALVPTLPRHRAALAGSISAGCASLRTAVAA